jgi:hypothetical protein
MNYLENLERQWFRHSLAAILVQRKTVGYFSKNIGPEGLPGGHWTMRPTYQGTAFARVVKITKVGVGVIAFG